MKIEENYLEINRQSWNNVVDVHKASDFYDMEKFRSGATSLKSIELNLLGDVKGKTILHLQCHFGQDSLSLARMGAQVTGIDFSDKAIDTARNLSRELGLSATFICCDVYSTLDHITEKFDIVYTSYGTIGWLPELNDWAKVVSSALKPGGKLIFVEFHPVVWMFDNHFKKVQYSYFNKDAIIETTDGTYTNRDAPITNQSVSWNHSLAEVLESLLRSGLTLEHVEEFDYAPYNCFEETEEYASGKYRIKDFGNKIPIVNRIME